MATIVTRTVKGQALTFVEADANFTNLNTDKLELTNLSVGTEASASGDGAIAYNNTTGVFTYTPPTAAGIGAATSAQGALADSALQNLSDDTTPQLGGALDVDGNAIVNNVTNGSIIITPNGTGGVDIGGVGLNLVNGSIYTTTTDQNMDIGANGDGFINLNSATNVAYFQSHGEMIGAPAQTTGTITIDPADGPIQYLALTGNATINGLTNANPGQTVTIIIDGSGGSYTLTLGGGVYMPGGTAAITDGGLDLLTITYVDDEAGLYIGSIVNDFQPTV